LRIYDERKKFSVENVSSDSQTWAYPTIAKAFYDPLSHKIGMNEPCRLACLLTCLFDEFAIYIRCHFVFVSYHFTSTVVPLSLILMPYFHPQLPPYLHYSTVGTAIAKEILRSVTKAFEEKAMRCVPTAVEIFSNTSRMELLISSGGMQIAYHSMLTLSGSKAMARLPGLNLSSTQIFFLLTAQELCTRAQYEGVETDSEEFRDM